MKIYKLNIHGAVLTGRDYGALVMKEINQKMEKNMILDFEGVASLGSSFGDEVITPIARFNGGYVEVCNVSPAVKTALDDVANDGEINITYISELAKNGVST